MDLDKLTQQDRLSIWEQFQGSPAWLLLCRELRSKKAQTPIVTNADTKEAFFYAAIRNQAIDELLNLPDELIGHIQRSIK